MLPIVRNAFNTLFTDDAYQAFLHTVNTTFGEPSTFRICETPIFVPKDLHLKLLNAVQDICSVINHPGFKQQSASALPIDLNVPNENAHTHFLQLDFGICHDNNGQLYPQLIEMQGFPSLYFFQLMLANAYRKHFNIPQTLNHLFGGITSENYIELLREVIVDQEKPENVVLLEIEPKKQNTRIDFWGTQKYLGIKVLCLSELIQSGQDLYYLDETGRKIAVHRIYNRIIFDELEKRSDLPRQWDLYSPVNAKWVGHPNWFFRISKHTLPSIQSPFVPTTHFLSDIKTTPTDLSNWVLKPLFSFSGQGVIINPTEANLHEISKPEQYILQRKVTYAPFIQTPNPLEMSKCEIRMMLIWKDEWDGPRVVNNLIRVSKGEMVGVRYNKGKDWVGASVGFFEP